MASEFVNPHGCLPRARRGGTGTGQDAGPPSKQVLPICAAFPGFFFPQKQEWLGTAVCVQGRPVPCASGRTCRTSETCLVLRFGTRWLQPWSGGQRRAFACLAVPLCAERSAATVLESSATPPPPPPLQSPPPHPGDRHLDVFLVIMYCAGLCCPSALRMALHCFPITTNQAPVCVL